MKEYQLLAQRIEMVEDAMDAKIDLIITIMSSLAQEESRSISENVTRGHRKRFSDGKASLPYAM